METKNVMESDNQSLESFEKLERFLNMLDFVKIDDHKKSDGSIDWTSYDAARIKTGERCLKCGACIAFPKGYESFCSDCRCLTSDNSEVSHQRLIRCPKCSLSFKPSDDDYDLYSEGEHKVSCPYCEHDFEISVRVEYTFVSPPAESTENGQKEE